VQNAGDGAGADVNTGGTGDGLILVVLLMSCELALRPLGWASVWLGSLLADFADARAGVLGGVARALASWLAAPSAAGESGRWLLMVPFVVLALVLLGRSALGRLVGLRRYEVGRAAFMALAGAPVVLVATIFPLALLAGLAEAADQRWLSTSMLALASSVPVGASGFWSGWRFGRWGWAWGIGGIALTGLLALGLKLAVPNSVTDALIGSALLTCGALGGWLGARQFQRGRLKRSPTANEGGGGDEAR
jgi:hypothetical protein